MRVTATLQFAARHTRAQQQPPPPSNDERPLRFALPINTHGNLKHLHDKAQAHDDGADKTGNQTATSAAASKPRRDSSSSKLSQKMKMLFLGKNTKAQPTPEEEAELTERKRSTMSQLIGSHAFVQMGRR